MRNQADYMRQEGTLVKQFSFIFLFPVLQSSITRRFCKRHKLAQDITRKLSGLSCLQEALHPPQRMNLQRSLSQDTYETRERSQHPHSSWIRHPSALISSFYRIRSFRRVTREVMDKLHVQTVNYISFHHFPERQNKIIALTLERIYRNVVESISRAPVHLFI